MKIVPETVFPEVHHVNDLRLTQKTPHNWGPRRIPDYEIILAVHGEFEFLQHETGECLHQRPGTVLTIYPEELHSFRLTSSEGEFCCIHLNLQPGLPSDKPAGISDPSPWRLTVVPRLDELLVSFRETFREYVHGGIYRDALVSTLTRKIWLRLADVWHQPEAPGKGTILGEMLCYLREHRRQHPGRQELASEFKLTPQHINLLFRRNIGMTPTRYVQCELMRDAYAMLIEKQLSVKETAFQLRFSNPFYFSLIFKREFGFSPGLRKK